MNLLNESHIEILMDGISSLSFQMSRIDGSCLIFPLRLLEGGEIYGHSSANEYTWKIQDGELFFYAKDGRVSTAFGKPFLENDKLTFTGDFLLRPQLNIKHKIQEIDFTRDSLDINPMLTHVAFQEEIKRFGWEIGAHSYGKPRVLESRMAGLKIGKFCSMAAGVTLILGNHVTNTATTYPFTALRKYWPGARRDAIEDHQTNGDIVIGNDVWIGSGVTIMSGVTIGDGSVIAANSVVTKDVQPYSIVGGTPAKLLRMRHSSEVIEELINIKWWNWSDELIDERIKYLLSDVNEFVTRFK